MIAASRGCVILEGNWRARWPAHARGHEGRTAGYKPTLYKWELTDEERRSFEGRMSDAEPAPQQLGSRLSIIQQLPFLCIFCKIISISGPKRVQDCLYDRDKAGSLLFGAGLQQQAEILAGQPRVETSASTAGIRYGG